ncbi:MAG: DUF1810 domain-containing protein [Pirellulales bacterium]
MCALPFPSSDPFQLERFLAAQASDYLPALGEIRAGRKRTHWMWYIFPQFAGLGFSPMSRQFAIGSRAEAVAYLAHPVLGERLRECMEAASRIEGKTARDIFGSPDDLKLRSCATLFAEVSPPGSVFERILTRFYGGERDTETLRLLAAADAR